MESRVTTRSLSVPANSLVQAALQEVDGYTFANPARELKARTAVDEILQAGALGLERQVAIRAKTLLQVIDRDQVEKVLQLSDAADWQPGAKLFAVFPAGSNPRVESAASLIIRASEHDWLAAPADLHGSLIPGWAMRRALELRKAGLGLHDLRVAVPENHPRFRDLLARNLAETSRATAVLVAGALAAAALVVAGTAVAAAATVADPVLLARLRPGSPYLVEIARWE